MDGELEPHRHSAAFRSPAFAPALFLAGYLCLFQPVQVYQGNVRNFFFGLAQLSLVLVPAFVAAFALFAASAAWGARWRRARVIALTALAFAMWAAGTFITASHGSLDGHTVLARSSRADILSNAFVYAAFLAGGAWLAARAPQIARKLLLALFTVLLVHAGWSVSRDAKPWHTSDAIERLPR